MPCTCMPVAPRPQTHTLFLLSPCFSSSYSSSRCGLNPFPVDSKAGVQKPANRHPGVVFWFRKYPQTICLYCFCVCLVAHGRVWTPSTQVRTREVTAGKGENSRQDWRCLCMWHVHMLSWELPLLPRPSPALTKSGSSLSAASDSARHRKENWWGAG